MIAKEMKDDLRKCCPNCDGSGVIPNGVTKMDYGTDENGEQYERGTYIEWEPEQCQWCDEFCRKLQDFTEQLCRE